MSSLAIDELKSHLNAFVQSMTSGATTSDIIAGFRKSHARSIEKAGVELEDMGLTKLVNSVGKRRPSKFAGEPDLFSGFGIPNAIVVRDDKGRQVHIPIGKASISQGRSWANGRKKAPLRTAQQIEMQRLVEEIEPYADDENTTIEVAIIASRAERDKREV